MLGSGAEGGVGCDCRGRGLGRVLKARITRARISRVLLRVRNAVVVPGLLQLVWKGPSVIQRCSMIEMSEERTCQAPAKGGRGAAEQGTYCRMRRAQSRMPPSVEKTW